MISVISALPELEGVTAQYVRDQLPLLTLGMLAGLSNLRFRPFPCSSSLPTEVELIPTAGASGAPPSHVLAVCSSEPSAPGTEKMVTLIPTHQLVLAAHCANLLPLTSATSLTTTLLPIFPLNIPCAGSFPRLHAYLYSKDASVLLPPPPSEEAEALTLLHRALFVHGLWKNACALGVVDVRLYGVLQEYWQEASENLDKSMMGGYVQLLCART